MFEFLFNLIVLPLYVTIGFLFDYLLKNTHNIVLIIFIISTLLFVVCLPLYLKADFLQAKEREFQKKLKNKVDIIKRHYKGDERHMLLSAYYRQMHYHPIMRLRSSLGLILQIPFFMAAYSFFSNLTLLDKTRFWKIVSLAKPDHLINIGGYAINLLPIIMTIINILAIFAYTREKFLKRKLSLISVSLFFLILLYNAPSGLVLFWIFNNIFSLIKNICLNFMSQKNLIKLTYITAIIGYCFLQTMLNVHVSMITFMILCFLFIFKNFVVKVCNNFSKSKSLFFLSGLTLFSLIGVYTPLNLISNSPLEFVYSDSSPLGIVFFNMTIWAGVFLFWGGVVYYFSNEFIRKILSIVTLFFVSYSLCNFLLIKMPEFSISDRLGFETNRVNFYNTFEPMYLYFICIVMFFATLFLFLFLKKEKLIRRGILFILLSTISVCIPKFYRIKMVMQEYKNEIEDVEVTDQKLIHLSKNGKNVIVFFLDGFTNTYVPLIFEEKPDFYKQFSGFTYYPNTLSHASYTILGYLPILGGYEYTPMEMDKRDGLFEEKLKQAVTVLPAIFSNNGWNSKVLNPIDIGWTKYMKWGDVSIRDAVTLSSPIFYNDFHIEYQQIPDSVILKSAPEHNTLQFSETTKDNILFYSLLPFLSPQKREYVYDDGSYHHHYKQYKRRYRKEFTRCYSQLAQLETVTDFESSKNSFIVVNNNLPHTPDWLSYPNYDFDPINDTSYKPRLRADANYQSLLQYHVNMASLKLIGKYLDFLKEKGVYDNSRIIIVSDHSYDIDLNGYSNAQRELFGYFNSVLMFKDFNQNGKLKTNKDFMTNADVPMLLVKNLIKNPTNPYTNLKLTDAIKKNLKKYGMLFKRDYKWSPSNYLHKDKVFLPNDNYSFVKGDFHNPRNWHENLKLKEALMLLKNK